MRRAPAVGVALLLLLLLLLASCAGPRNTLNTPASTCFRGLPAAGAAVRHKGRVIGVRIVHKAALAHRLPQAERIVPGSVCAIGFRGEFARGDVAGADPAGPGHYAIVALDTRGSRVLATFVVDALPVRFRHRT